MISDPAALAGAFDSVVTQFSLMGGQEQMVLPANPNRVWLQFQARTVASQTIWPQGGSPINGAIELGPLEIYRLTLSHVGGIIQREWFATEGGAGGIIVVWDSQYYPERLLANPEAFYHWGR